MGLAVGAIGVVAELALDQVVGPAPWLVVSFAAGLAGAILGGPAGGIITAGIELAGQVLAIPAWVPAVQSLEGTGWQVEVATSAVAFGAGLVIRGLILGGPAGQAVASPGVAERHEGAEPDPVRAPAAAPAAPLPSRAEVDVLAAAIRDFGAVRTPVQVADALGRHAAALTGTDAATIYLAARDGSGLVPLGRSGGADPGAPDRLDPERLETAATAPDRAGIVLHPITAQVGGRTRVIGAIRLRAMAGEPRASALLPAVVQLAANALEGGRLEVARRTSDEDATRAGRRLAIISRLALELVGGRTIDGVSATLLGLAVDDLGAGFATVHVTDESSGEYHLTGSRGVPAGLSASLRTIAADAPSPVTRAAASRERVEIDGEDGWREAFPRTSNIPAITGVRAITAMPMVAGGRAHGVLTIGWRTAADRTAADHGMLAAAAAQGAQALERAILHAHDEDARRFQEAFIGVVSHELRTPITTIVAGSRLLKRRLTGNAAAEELTDDIEVEADRLTRIVDDLLVLSRLERRHLTIGDDPVHLDHLLARVVRSEETRWPTHTIVLPSSPNRHVVLGDETYVEQVLRNLISNAAKYSPSGSTIRVTIEDLANGDVEVRVLDEGSGISPAEVEDLFSLFYRSPSTAASAAGAGIGLFVSRQLVTEMGGRMWARPRPEGGSEFGLSLSSFPIDEPEALDDEDPEPSPATAGVD